MICPFCGRNDDRVIDSRSSDGSRAIRRRRVCNDCNKRFTTYERVESAVRLMVIKRDGTRQAFDTRKIQSGLAAACGKRPIAVDDKAHLIEKVEDELFREFDREVPSSVIGARVAKRLRRLDQIAYIRFASEWLNVKDIDELIEVAQDVKELAGEELPGQGELFHAPASPDEPQ